MEDVHRAGGVVAILSELDRAGLIHRDVPTIHSKTLAEGLETWDIMRHGEDSEARRFYRAAPGGVPTTIAFSQSMRYPGVDDDRAEAASATRPMPTRRTAAWPCCTAISPNVAAS
jgi:dihydroxy-acid dehydratase